MTFHQLKIFSAVATNRNVSKTAVELRISQPSLSRQLKLLEEDLGLKLYQKIKEGIQLTQAGQLFFDHIQPILRRVDRLKSHFAPDPRRGRASFLIIGGSPSLSVSLLPTLSAIFKRSHPGVEIVLRTDPSRGIEWLVLNAEAELGVISDPSYHPALTTEPSRQQKLVVFASSAHALAKKEKISLAELSRTPLVIKTGKRMTEILRRIEEQGLRPNVALHCESQEAVKSAVRMGIGLGILYQDLIESDIKRGELKIIRAPEIETTVDTYVVRHHRRPLSPAAQDFLALLRNGHAKEPAAPRPNRANV